MIVWCRECKTNVAPLDWDRCSACVVKYSPAYSLTEYFSAYESCWEARNPRIEFNTVDLKKLREDWQDRRYNMPLEGWQRLKDQLKHVF